MKLLSEDIKVDIALTAQSLDGAGTGPYYRMDRHRKALFVAEIGAMAAAATSALQIMQAQDAAAGGAKVVTNNTATITANVKVASATLTLATVLAGDKVTINGLIFTAHTDTTTPANREFSISGTDDEAAAELATCINDPTYGVPGVTATPAAAVVTLDASEPGDVTITITDPAATITPATVRAIGYVECDASFLDIANGYDHLALRITNSAAMLTGAVLVRGNSRYSPEQQVAAAKADVA